MTEFFFSYKKGGLRQGCLLSAYLFIICIELLTAKVRENKMIKLIIDVFILFFIYNTNT